jgi:hypothetical protein
MKFFIILNSILCLIAGAPFLGHGQNNQVNHKVNIEIPDVALIGLVSNGDSHVNFIAAAPGEAGNRIELAKIKQNKEVWLNYSSIIRSHTHRRKVVAVVQGEIPPGLRLTVEASPPAGRGKGMLGSPSGRINLTTDPTELISDIGSCYTGMGPNNGHLLSYRLEEDDSGEAMAALTENQISLQVVFTLTDNN